MTKLLTKTWSEYQNSKNTDYKETYRELETSKRFSEIDAEAQEFNASLIVFINGNKVDLDNITMKDYRKLCSLYALEISKEIREVKKDSATVIQVERITTVVLSEKNK